MNSPFASFGLGIIVMRALCSLVLFFTYLATASAADTRMIKARSLELQTVADAHFGPITIRATASDEHSLESLTIEGKTMKLKLPSEVLHDIRDADIQTIHLDAILYDPARPFLTLRLDSWDPAYRRVTGKPASIEFRIEDGVLTFRCITWEDASGRRYTDNKKFKPSTTK